MAVAVTVEPVSGLESQFTGNLQGNYATIDRNQPLRAVSTQIVAVFSVRYIRFPCSLDNREIKRSDQGSVKVEQGSGDPE